MKIEIPLIDRSKYLKGLFITAKLDKQLEENEKIMLRTISDKLGFAKDFFDETIRSLLANKYISEDHLTFSSEKIAETFLLDAIKLACADGKITESEKKWLLKTAESNNINEDWIQKKIKSTLETPIKLSSSDFALFSII